MRILLVGHACGPGLGSEPGTTWNWAWHLSAYHRVWVLAHPQYREAVDRFLAEYPNPHLQFVWVTLPSRWDPWDPNRRERGTRLHYLLWQRAVFQEASRLHDRHDFDLVHHASWNTLSTPPLLWRLQGPFVWGPVGGGQTTSSSFRPYFGMAWRRECVRALRIRLAPFLPPPRRAVRESALVLRHQSRACPRPRGSWGSRHASFPGRRTPPAVSPSGPASTPPWPPDNREIILRARPKVLLFLGRLALGQKGLDRLLHGYAAFLAHTGDRQTHLTLAGPDFRNGRQSLEKLAADLRIVDRVSFKGPVNGEAKWTLLRSSYALVHPSRWEGMPFSVLEALAVGCPALITAETNLAEMVQAHATGIVASGLPQDIAQGLQELISMPPERYDAMRHQARKVIEDHYTWDQVTASMAQPYQDVVGGARHT